MPNDWLLNLFCGDEPTQSRPIPKVPILHERRVIAVSKRTAETDSLIRKLETERAIEMVCGQEVATLVKEYTPVSPGSPATVSLPTPTKIDPHNAPCSCQCQMCRSGSGCYNCLAEPKCEFHSLTILDGILPVDEKTAGEFRQAASSRQRERGVSIFRKGRLQITQAPGFERWEVLPSATG